MVQQNGRGKLTPEIEAKSEELLGYAITQRELRLMPYIQHVMMNDQRLDLNRINSEEREIVSNWRKRGFLEGGAGPMVISRRFWDVINDLMWMAYVNYHGEADPVHVGGGDA
jgi:hypothetical protein